jgi:presenilin-like A22 family membrane protease
MNPDHPAFGGFPPPGDSNEYDSSNASFDPYDDPRPTAKNKVYGPAIGLIIIGVACVLLAIYTSVDSARYKGWIHNRSREIQQSEDMSAGQKRTYVNALKIYENWLPVINGLNAVLGALVAIGGVQMMTLSARWLCYTACILSFVPMATGCCCCFGVIIGVWGIVMLGHKDVVAGFIYQTHASNRKK